MDRRGMCRGALLLLCLLIGLAGVLVWLWARKMGWRLEYTHPDVYTGVLCACGVGALCVCCGKRMRAEAGIAILLPLTICVDVFLMLGELGRLGALLAMVALACGLAAILTMRLKILVKLIAGFVVAIPAAAVGLLLIASMLFSDFGAVTTVEKASPDRKWLARVTESDEGALGGAVIVSVCQNEEFDLGWVKLWPREKTLARHQWFSVAGGEINWLDENDFSFVGETYQIDKP